MWVNGVPHICSITAHLDRQTDFADQITRMRTHNAATDDPVCLGVKEQLGEAFISTVGNGTARSGPREHGFSELAATGFALLFGQACPSNFGVGVGNRGNLQWIKDTFVACSYFGSDMPLMYGLMSQHRLTNKIANGEDVRYVGAHLIIDLDEASFVDNDASFVCRQFAAVG